MPASNASPTAEGNGFTDAAYNRNRRKAARIFFEECRRAENCQCDLRFFWVNAGHTGVSSRSAHMANRESTPGAEPPEESRQSKLRKPHRVAAGMRALRESLRFTMRETGLTRGLTDWLKVNKKNGFDCQSCAWPSPDDDRHVFEFCENGVKALTSEATRKKITPDFFREHSIVDLQKQSDNWLELQGRLVHPMVKHPGATHYEPIEWVEAFTLMARELNALPTPNAAAFYTSGRTSNEAAFLYQLFPLKFAAKMLFNKGTPISDLWLPVKLNGDMAAMQGIMKEMLAEEERSPGSVFDHEFIEKYTSGFETFVRHLRDTPWDAIIESSGLTRDQIREAATIAKG